MAGRYNHRPVTFPQAFQRMQALVRVGDIVQMTKEAPIRPRGGVPNLLSQ